MVKVRMNTADVAAEVKCLRRLIGMRCANIYDISPKTYIFKLMNSSGITESGESEKVLLLMESGIRLHTTAYARDKNTTPSGFTLKLRKHIRTRRLEDVRQLGFDRIILFQFGLGANAHYIILELYSQGNMLLTDADYTVMTLLRSHRDDDKGLTIMSRHRYPIEACRVFERTSSTKLRTTLICTQSTFSKDTQEIDKVNTVVEEQSVHRENNLPYSNKKVKDGGRSKSTLKVILGEALGYGPALSEHIILDAGLLPNTKIGNDNNYNIDDNMLQSLELAVARFEDWLTDIIFGQKLPEGYILMQNGKEQNSLPSEVSQVKFYDEVCPILLSQFKCRDFVKLETFDAALDEFYSKIENQRAEQQQKAKEGFAVQKLDKIRSDQENRVHMLKKEVDHSIRMAELIEYNLQDVDAAILAVRVALANGMDWMDLARMVKEEKRSGNPVAGLIDKLNLERNCITLLLSNNLDEMDEDEIAHPVDKVEVDLALSAHANARRWYELKKKQENKEEKTVTAHDKAFKAAERKTRLQLAQEKTIATISHMRKVHWFEKFNWFVTSENYLVISGRDAQQNEMIVKRYMSKGDVYVHADLHGASTTVIKNQKPENPVPPLTLNQAGCYTVCQSQAWDSKIVTSAWWVYPHQVSKTAPTGEYLTVGSFMIRGKKNFLPPHPLVMGFGILFRLDESSLALHLNERRVRVEDEGLHEIEGGGTLHQQCESESQGKIQNVDVNGSSDEPFYSKHPQPELKALDDTDPNASVTISSDSKLTCTPKNLLEVDHMVNNSDEADYVGTSEKARTSVSQLEDLIDSALELGSTKILGRNCVADAPRLTPEENDGKGGKVSSGDKPHISKSERRKLKKAQNHNVDLTSDINEKKECNISHGFERSANITKPSSKIMRGRKGKVKKIQDKYGEQDDEERRIRMSLLASAGKPGKDEKELDTKNEVASGAMKLVTGQESTKICYKCKKPGHLSKDCQAHEAVPLDKHVSKGTFQDLTDAESHTIDSQLDRVAIDEDDIHEIGEDEKGKLNDIDYLTSNPLPNDILLYGVPICGPYSALQTYKYRVKITPGTVKKGKAAKTAVNLFCHRSDATNREKELIKACTDSELVAAIIGNAKISAPGFTQLKQKQKKDKKSGKST